MPRFARISLRKHLLSVVIVALSLSLLSPLMPEFLGLSPLSAQALETDALAASQASDEGTESTGASQRIFVLPAPFLSWGDITQEATPRLASLLETSGLGNAVLRSSARSAKGASGMDTDRGDEEQAISPDEALASMAAGYFVEEPYDLVTQPRPLDESDADSSIAAQSSRDVSGASGASDGEISEGENEAGTEEDGTNATAYLFSENVHYGDIYGDTYEDAQGEPSNLPGTLADALQSAGWKTIALGCSDTQETAVRPAAVFASNSNGVVDLSNTQPENLLDKSADYPGGAQTNLDRFQTWLDAALASLSASGESGTGALIALDSGDLYRAGCERIDNPGSASDESWESALASFDEVVGMALDRMDVSSGDVLIVVAPLSLAQNAEHDDDSYAPVIIYGGGYDGLLGSASTGRDDLVVAADFYETILDMAQVSGEDLEWSSPIKAASGSQSLSSATLVTDLARMAGAADAINDSIDVMNVVLFSLLALSFGFSILMLSTRLRFNARVLAVLIPVTRILWVVASAYPLATNLVGLFLGAGSSPGAALAICMALTLSLAFIALLFGRFTRWIYSIVFLMLLTVVILSLDQLTGGNLAQVGYLTYQPILASRFYGIGNEGAAVLFGAWLMLSGLLLNRFGDHRAARPFRAWGFPLCTALIILVIVAPWWGANFGVLVWGIVGGGCAWWMFNGHRLTWKAVLFTVAASLALLFVLILADGLYSGSSHLGTMASDLLSQGLSYIPSVFSTIVSFGIETLVYSPLLTVVLAFLWLYLAYLRIKKPGPYSVFWSRNEAFKGAFTAAMIVAVIVLLIEDSGILLPALVLIYSTAGLTWMVCDLHRWELRAHEHAQGKNDDEVDKPVGGFKVIDR